MANPIWLTGQGLKVVNLGTVTEGSYFEYPLDAYDPSSGPVKYKFLAGTIPPGIRVNVDGFIQGGPYLNTAENKTAAYEFTVRASDQHGLVSDKTFSMVVANINPPVIVPRITDLGEVFDGDFYDLQLYATELNPYANLTWELTTGSLPAGLTFTSTGLISGFILPLATYGNGGAQGFNANPFNEFAFENTATYQSNNYQFTVKVFDGTNYDSLTYTLRVTARDQFTADNSVNTIDDTYLTIDNNNVYSPIMLTPSQALPEVRSNSKFAFKFSAFDPEGATLTFAISLTSSGVAGFDQGGTQGFDSIGFDQQNLSVPPGLVLDPTTGWFSGTVGPQIEAVQVYTFQIYVYDVVSERQSLPVTYTMTVLGDITNTITWITNSDLGIIDNGAISELAVSAINRAGHELTYSLISAGSNLPQGLQLDRSGLITGRAGFEFFSLDGGATTIDGEFSNFDNVHSFIVQATNVDGTASSQQTFTVKVNNFNLIPYENLYLKALPTKAQRNTFLDIVNNTDIFPESLIYRSSDPNFGRARDIRSLFMAGLSPTTVPDYLSAMATNTYNKRIEFSDIKTAVAVDADFKTKYEVVYVELQDDASLNGKSPANNRMDTDIGRTIYPNSFQNMTSVVANATGYANIGALPGWMTSPQADKRQLGFTRAVVLAYTVPGASKLIAYRLAANGIAFNTINFVLDRYDLDNSYSSNYNIDSRTYDLGRETTFDRIKRPTVNLASATYGVAGLSFSMINNQTVAQINARGGLDGITTFADGDTMIFIQQEDYPGETGLYDGWTNNSGIIPGWIEFTNSVKIADGTLGFPTSPRIGQVTLVNQTYYIFTADYDTNGNLIDTVWKVADLRAGIWRINIDANNLVTLTPTTFQRNSSIGANGVSVDASFVSSMIFPNDRVQINQGKSHSESIAYYDPVLYIGNSVPAYTVLPTLLSDADKITRFDGYGTRFINNRIAHQNPEAGDTWLKFPNTGPLL